jgi:site-specific recombinase XerD
LQLAADKLDATTGKALSKSLAAAFTAMNLAVKKCTFAGVELGKLRRSHVETGVKSMVSDGLAASTIRTRVDSVRSVWRAATRDRLMSNDPSDGVTLPRLRKSEHAPKIATSGQVRAILEAAEDWLRPYICAFAGRG